jgi:glutathione S-transferase
MITVYAFGNLPPPVIGLTRDLRALWALEESGLPYRVHPLDFARGELSAPDYIRINPFGHVPSIDDDGFRLFESGAIVLYVAEKAGKLIPEGARERALAAQWAFAAVNTVEPEMSNLCSADIFFADAAWAKKRRPALVDAIERRLAVLEKELAGRPFLMGDDFSAPDILMATVLRQIQHTDLLAGAATVAAYKARCEDRPAWQKIYAAYERRLAA